MKTLLPILLACALTAAPRTQSTVTLQASKDNTLYQNTAGSTSNAKGQHFFTGRTLRAGVRRAVIAFDIRARVPKGAKIVRAALSMHMNRTRSFASAATGLHRATNDWGEGTSRAFGAEGRGAGASSGDATWIHTFWNTKRWTSAGGDYVASASATTGVAGVATYSWTSAQLTADVQAFLDKPATNFGWVVITAENQGRNAKRWSSRENSVRSRRPVLQITYTPPKANTVATGTGCKDGSGRALTHTTNSPPRVPNPNYTYQISNGPPNGVALFVFAVGLIKPALRLNNNNCFLYVNPTRIIVLLPTAFNATGAAGFLGPVPNDPGLIGACYETQGFSFNRSFVLRSSNALTHNLGT